MEQKHVRQYKRLFDIGVALVCFMLLLAVLRIVPAGAQSSVDSGGIQSLERKIETFFGELRRVTPAPAPVFTEFLEHSPLGSDPSRVSELRRDVNAMSSQFGDILGSEKLDTRQIGTNTVVIRYLLLYDQYPVMWSFVFYRKPSTTPGTWTLVALQFDTNLL